MAVAFDFRRKRSFPARPDDEGQAASFRERLAGAVDTVRRGNAARPELLLIPQDLRTADPGFFAELAAGTMGLAGATVQIDGTSPFLVTPPSQAWQAALLGFSWLSDLRAANLGEAQALARRTVDDWIAQGRTDDAADWTAGIAARRLMSWLANAGMLVESGSPAAYDRFLVACDLHMRRLPKLAAVARGEQKLTAYIALLTGSLCLSDHEAALSVSLRGLEAELGRQILDCGGHISRQSGVLVELMLDLLPLKQCFIARDLVPPPRLLAVMRKITPMLRHMQLGDRRLARFNGMAATSVDRLATALSYDAGAPDGADLSLPSRYFRLRRRGTIVLMDGGVPPAPEYARQAHAGALSFEMSSGDSLIFVNAGAPGPADESWRSQARGTPAHTALVLNETASSRLIREGGKPAVLTGPATVEAKFVEPGDGAIEIQSLHDGYQDQFGMVHARILRLSAHGDRLSGIDRIYQPQRIAPAGRADRNYGVHFHVHPQARVRYLPDAGAAEIDLRNGETWRFVAHGAKLAIEDSLFLATFTGPLRSVQIVLRGHAFEDTQVRWSLERVPSHPGPLLADGGDQDADG